MARVGVVLPLIYGLVTPQWRPAGVGRYERDLHPRTRVLGVLPNGDPTGTAGVNMTQPDDEVCTASVAASRPAGTAGLRVIGNIG
jgi:hypothetical protein